MIDWQKFDPATVYKWPSECKRLGIAWNGTLQETYANCIVDQLHAAEYVFSNIVTNDEVFDTLFEEDEVAKDKIFEYFTKGYFKFLKTTYDCAQGLVSDEHGYNLNHLFARYKEDLEIADKLDLKGELNVEIPNYENVFRLYEGFDYDSDLYGFCYNLSAQALGDGYLSLDNARYSMERLVDSINIERVQEESVYNSDRKAISFDEDQLSDDYEFE